MVCFQRIHDNDLKLLNMFKIKRGSQSGDEDEKKKKGKEGPGGISC